MSNSVHTIRFGKPLKGARLVAGGSVAAGQNQTSQRERHQDVSPPATQPQSSAVDSFNFEELAAVIVSELNDLEQRRQNSIVELRQLALELALAATSKLMMRELEAGQYPFEEVINEMISVAGEMPTAIFLNPQDYSTLGPGLEKLKSLLDQHKTDIKSADCVQRGGCRIELSGFELVRDPLLLIEEIRQSVLEEIHDASIERRRNDSKNSNLQRFPDRRSAS